MSEVIKIEKLSKSYVKSKKTVLKDITLTVYRNEFITIGGVSGSGKSTLLRILGLIDTHFEGKFYFQNNLLDQHDIDCVDNFRKNIIGVVFQDFNLIDRYTVYRNLELALIVNQVPFKKRNNLIVNALRKVNLSPLLCHHLPQELSGGQKQRVAIARAILTEPLILIADEPTGSLDDANSEDIMNLFKSLDITLIIATHDLRIAQMSDRHIDILEGKVYVR